MTPAQAWTRIAFLSIAATFIVGFFFLLIAP
jgi:hypothetical protein